MAAAVVEASMTESVQKSLSAENFAKFTDRLTEEGVAFADLCDWSQRDLCDAIEEVFGESESVDSKALVRAILDAQQSVVEMKKVQHTVNPHETSKAASRATSPFPGEPTGTEDPPVCVMCGAALGEKGCERPVSFVCSSCGAVNATQIAMKPNLDGVVAIVTGGRKGVGFAAAVRLLRLGATVHITTRFPVDALRRYALLEDIAQFQQRFFIHGVDFTQIKATDAFTKTVLDQHDSIHILINNAAQSVVRPAEAYAEELALENQGPAVVVDALAANPDTKAAPEVLQALKERKEQLLTRHNDPMCSLQLEASIDAATAGLLGAPADEIQKHAQKQEQLTQIDQKAKKSKKEKEQLRDAEILPTVATTEREDTLVEDVSIVEATAAHLVNAVTPMSLITAFYDALTKKDENESDAVLGGCCGFVVNVTSPDGQFSSIVKSEFHPHRNMAKASLNMLTRTVAADLAKKQVYVSSVDNGVMFVPINVNDNDDDTVELLVELDACAARVLQPVVEPVTKFQEAQATGNYEEVDLPHHGVLLRHFKVADW